MVPIEFFLVLAISGALAGFSIICSLARPSKYYRILKRLERAVAEPKRRRVGKPLARPNAVRERTSVAELTALRQLRQVMRRRRRKAADEKIKEP